VAETVQELNISCPYSWRAIVRLWILVGWSLTGHFGP